MIFRVINWLFSIGSKYRRNAIKYESKNTKGRIGTIFLLFTLVALLVGTEYLCFHAFSKNVIVGLLLVVILISSMVKIAEECFVYGVIGFKSAIKGTLRTIIDKISKNDDSEAEKVLTESNNLSGVIPSKKHKLLDFFVGVIGIICGLAAIALPFVIFIQEFKK